MDADEKADLVRDIEYAMGSAESALESAKAEDYAATCDSLEDVLKLVSGWERDLKQEIADGII